MNCDDFGWAIYMPTDEVEKYEGRVETGRYYIETTEAFALEGNGWYCDSVIKKALQFKLSTEEDIRFQLNSPLSLKPNHFKQFGLDLYEKNSNVPNKQLMDLSAYWVNPKPQNINIILNQIIMQ